MIVIIVLFVYVFMVAPRMFHRPKKKNFFGKHYAHRGLFDNDSYAPENSIPAFKKAVEAGYGIELDVQLSKDGKVVVFHDANLERMCGIDGNVWEYDLEQLSGMKLAASNERIPTLEQVLRIVDGKVPLIIEYKLDVVQTNVCKKAEEILQKYKGTYCIESFHPLALLWYRKNRPKVMRGQLAMEFWKEEKYSGNPLFVMLSFMFTNFVARPDFIAYKHSDAANLSRRVCRWLGAVSVAWTIKSVDEYEKAKDKFDLFIFDNCRL